MTVVGVPPNGVLNVTVPSPSHESAISLPSAPVGRRDREDCEGVRYALLHPRGQSRCALLVLLDDAREPGPGRDLVRAVKDPSKIPGDFASHLCARHVRRGVALQMYLAALPGHARQARRTRGAESRVVVADRQANAMHASVLQRFQEVSPVHLSLGHRDADAEHATLAVPADADGDQHRLVDDRTTVSHLLAPRVEHEVGHFAQSPITPLLELVMETLGGSRDLGPGLPHPSRPMSMRVPKT